MTFDQGLADRVGEALEPLGTLTLRKMMGGATLYLGGVIFAIIADDALWFKADKQSDAVWDAAGLDRFSFDFGDGKMKGVMNYRRAPDDVYDDPDEMQRWAALALEAGQRTLSKKRKKR